MSPSIPDYPKTPSFDSTDLLSPITEIAVPLASIRDDGTYYACGTAVVLRGGLALTANHVIDDHLGRVEVPVGEPREVHATRSMVAIQILGQDQGAIWNVTRVWKSPHTDIAFLGLAPSTEAELGHRWRYPKVSLMPPAVGSRVAGFGYHSSSVRVIESTGGRVVEWTHEPTTTMCEVIEVHERRRDDGRLTFPCIRTNARFDGGMSGGPVFDAQGRLCGLICSSLPADTSNGEHVSCVASLWPAMATMIDADHEGFEKGVKYPALELARAGLIDAEGWDQIILFEDGRQVGLRKVAG